ncbi:MAG: sodium/proline symporter [Polyangiales bacterium]
MSESAALIPTGRWLVGAVFIASLLAFMAIGVVSSRHKQKSTTDYLLAGRNVSPWLVALSTVATMSSGFMFVGMIGFTYRTGLSSIWMLVGWAAGDYFAWRFFYRPLREVSQRRGAVSAIALLKPPNVRSQGVVVPIAGVLSVFYLSMYAAAQLKAGDTALQTVFGTPENVGSVLGAAIVLVYCYSGGIRASIWTDAAQSIVMFATMALLVFVAFVNVGGTTGLERSLRGLDPSLMSLFPADASFGFGIYFLGMVLGGFGVVGQPHVLVRSMCIEDGALIQRARRYYFLFLLPFYAMTIAVGLLARAIIPDITAQTGLSSEHALPVLGMTMLPEVLIGLMLAGLFSATMSTADSQIIACTSALIEDVFPRWKKSYTASKVATVGVTCVALLVAVSSADGVFALVLDAWAVLSCTLGPVLVISLFGWPYSRAMALVIMVTGFVASNWWVASPWAEDVYVNLPAMAAAFGAYAVMLAARRLPQIRTRGE